jgi:hypothetical protein
MAMRHLAVVLLVALGGPARADLPDAAALAKLEAQFAPVEIRVDLGRLPESERKVLGKLIDAARILDAVFLRQVWAGNPALLQSLVEDDSALGRARLRYFLRHKSPWDTQHEHAPFIPGVGARPPQGNFYPERATKDEVEKWIASLAPAQKAAATGFYTNVRRDAGGAFTLVPYSVEFQNELDQAARLLDEAAALTAEPSLKRFLAARARAFRDNDYYASEVAWMELDSAVEPTIGPYETYEDGWFGYKASFEAFITVRDDAETAKLAKFSAELQGLEDALPIDPRYRNKKLGALSPIRVVNEVFASGDADKGVRTVAYNLPNDERVSAEKGNKRTLLKNIQEAKFRLILQPISRVALAAADQKDIEFDAFFTFVLMHELMHGLGPNQIVVGGEKTTPRKALKDLHSALEEAKADVSGLWALQRLIDKGTVARTMQRTLYDTYLAGAFRTLRFGAASAHGRGMAVQLNYLLDRGAVVVGKDGTFAIHEKKIRPAVAALTGELMTLQARGDYAGTKKLFDRLGVVRPEVQRVLDRLGAASIPVDIAPRYVTAAELRARP